MPNFIEADRMDDPEFWNATVNDATHHNLNAWILPGKYFEFTFHKPGEFGYHGKPWMRGKVTVPPLYPSAENPLSTAMFKIRPRFHLA